jgi:hypothetical protein
MQGHHQQCLRHEVVGVTATAAGIAVAATILSHPVAAVIRSHLVGAATMADPVAVGRLAQAVRYTGTKPAGLTFVPPNPKQ